MSLAEIIAMLMVVAVVAALMAGYPVALTLAGVSLAFAALGHVVGVMNFAILGALPQRIFGVMTNPTLLAIPLFIFMGVMLERSRIAEDLLGAHGPVVRHACAAAWHFRGARRRLLAAATGMVGATTVTMGLIVLPPMLRHGYDKRLAAGTVAATATLAQIFPPATVLVLLGDQLNNAYQSAQLAQGTFAPNVISVSDLFAGAIVPGLLLVGLYLAYLIAAAVCGRAAAPAMAAGAPEEPGCSTVALMAPVALIVAVLGSILGGIATPTEAASIGAVGAMLLAARKAGFVQSLMPVVEKTTQITSMIFLILIGATLFSLVFRALGGDDMVHRALADLPGGAAGAVLVVMLAVFLLGFVMDAFEIIFVVVPIVAPALLKMPGIDPVWLGIMIAVNLQTSYMHPPLGPTLFFLRGVAPPEITTRDIYIGIIPFVADPALRAGGAVVRAGACDRAAACALWALPGGRDQDDERAAMKAADMFNLAGRVALVTGASSGLGQQFARALADNGAAVALVARRAERLTAFKAELEKLGAKAVAIEADVTDRAAMIRAFDQAESAFGTVTILVNNAGVAHSGRALDMSPEEWRRVLATDLDAVFFWAQEAARRMLAANEKGAIVNIASVLGFGVAKGVAALRHRQSWRGADHQSAGARTRLQGRARQRDCARLVRHRDQRQISRKRSRHRDQARDSDRPLRRQRRSRRRASAAGVRRGELHDRRHHRGRRRADGRRSKASAVAGRNAGRIGERCQAFRRHHPDRHRQHEHDQAQRSAGEIDQRRAGT